MKRRKMKALFKAPPVFLRVKNPKNLAYIYKTVADTGNGLGDVIEAMIEFSRQNKFFMPEKALPAAKAEAARKLKAEKYKKLAKEIL